VTNKAALHAILEAEWRKQPPACDFMGIGEAAAVFMTHPRARDLAGENRRVDPDPTLVVACAQTSPPGGGKSLARGCCPSTAADP